MVHGTARWGQGHIGRGGQEAPLDRQAGFGSVVRWQRAQIVLWSAQHMDVPAIAKIAFTSEDRVREVIHNFNRDGFDSLAPKYIDTSLRVHRLTAGPE